MKSMFRIAAVGRLRHLGLAFGASAVLLTAVDAGYAPLSGGDSIPIESLSRIRGFNPDFVKYEDGNCLSENLQRETASDPEGAPPSWVGYECKENRNGVKCFTCGAAFDSKKNWAMGEGVPGAAIDPFAETDVVACSRDDKPGIQGVCTLVGNEPDSRFICLGFASYDCTSSSSDYPDQD